MLEEKSQCFRLETRRQRRSVRFLFYPITHNYVSDMPTTRVRGRYVATTSSELRALAGEVKRGRAAMRSAAGVAEETKKTEKTTSDLGTKFLLRWGRGSEWGKGKKSGVFDARRGGTG